MSGTCQWSPRAGGAFRMGGSMPIYEILIALAVSALAADSLIVIRLAAAIILAARERWKKHKRE